MTERDHGYLIDMLDEARNLAAFTAGADRADLDSDRKLQYAVVRSLSIFGEAARGVSDATREESPQIPWRVIIAMRHILVHDYGRVDLDEVWSAATSDVPALIPDLEALLDAADPRPSE